MIFKENFSISQYAHYCCFFSSVSSRWEIEWHESQYPEVKREAQNFIFSAHAYYTRYTRERYDTKKLFEYIILLYDRDGKSMFKSTRDKVWHLRIYVYACYIYPHRDQYYASIQHSLESRKTFQVFLLFMVSYFEWANDSFCVVGSTDRKKLCYKVLHYLLESLMETF